MKRILLASLLAIVVIGGIATVMTYHSQKAYADCGSSNCKYSEPTDSLAPLSDGKADSNRDPVQDCSGQGCAKLSTPAVIADCSGSGCKYNEPKDPLAPSTEGNAESSHTSPAPVQDCGGSACAKPRKPSAFSLMSADCSGANCKFNEPKDDPLASSDGKRTSHGQSRAGCGSSDC
jgi:hypothetical protein